MNPPRQHDHVAGAGDDQLMETNNPLFNDVIMKNCFSWMPIEDLKNVRLVCKFWGQASLLQWRTNCVVQIRGDRKRKSRSVNMAKSAQPSPLSVQDFLRYTGADNDPFHLVKIPFRKFHLSYLDLDLLKSGRDNTNQLEFWNSFGAQMTHLKIGNSVFHNEQTFRRILFEVTPNLQVFQLEKNYYKASTRFIGSSSPGSQPLKFVRNSQNNLKTMSIVLHEFDAEELFRCSNMYPIELPLSWAQILAYFPNLVSVQLECIDSDDFSCRSLEGFLNTLTNLRFGSNLHSLNLNVLNIINAKRNSLYTLSDGVLAHLQALHLPLTSLTFDIGIQTSADVFGEILRIHAATLRQLKVHRAPYAKAFPDFPFGAPLNSLEELTMIGPISQDLLFLEFMPELKRLIIVSEDPYKPFELAIEVAEGFIGDYRDPEPVIANTEFTLIPDLVLVHLKEFNAGSEEVSSEEKLNALKNLMPNLKKLHLLPYYSHAHD